MSMKLAAVAAVAAIIAMPGSAGAQVLTEKNISIKMAMAIAETALNECTPRVSVAVLDRAGRLRVFLQGDNASPHNLELARRKAYTALTFRRPSAEWAKRTAEGDVTGQRSLAEVIPLGGGVPIMIGEDAVGSVGLSGAPGGQPKEEACATKILSTLMRRAYRRPVTDADLRVPLKFYKDARADGGFEAGVSGLRWRSLLRRAGPAPRRSKPEP